MARIISLWVLMACCFSASAGAQEFSEEDLLTDLRRDLERTDEDGILAVGLTLPLLGPEAYPVLMDVLRTGDPTARANAALAFGWVPPDETGVPTEVLDALDRASVSDDDPRVRDNAAQTLQLLQAG